MVQVAELEQVLQLDSVDEHVAQECDTAFKKNVEAQTVQTVALEQV